MSVTVPGMYTLSNFEQPSTALGSMAVMPSGRVTSTISVLPEKPPIEITLCPSMLAGTEMSPRPASQPITSAVSPCFLHSTPSTVVRVAANAAIEAKTAINAAIHSKTVTLRPVDVRLFGFLQPAASSAAFFQPESSESCLSTSTSKARAAFPFSLLHAIQ